MGQAFAQSLDGARKSGPKEQKGKYYGKTIETGKKVQEVKPGQKKTEASLRQPSVNSHSKAYNSKYKKEQEQKEKRTPNSKTYKVGEGKYVSVVYLDKVHYKGSDGSLQDIDNTLVRQNNENDIYSNKANDFKANFPSSITKGKPIKIEKDNRVLELIPLDGNFSRSSVKDNAILYNDVLKGVDYQYTVLNSGVKEDIILNHYVDQNTFRFEIKAKDLDLREEKGAIFGYEKGEKKPSWTISAPYMVDGSGKISENLEIHLQKRLLVNDIVTVTADKDWLAAKERAYPVRIDPTVEIGSGSIADNCVEEATPDLVTNNSYSYIGYDDGYASGNLANKNHAHMKTRTFVRFNLPDIGEDQIIESAELAMYKYTRFGNTQRTIELHRVNSTLDNSDVNRLTWNNQPMDTSYETSTDISDNVGYVYWNIKDLVNSWYSGSPNNGVLLKYQNELEQCEVFASREYSGLPTPKVVIEHKDKGTIDPDMPLDAPTIILRPLVKSQNNGELEFAALSADGMSKPDSEVEYYTVPGNSLGFSGKVYADYSHNYPSLPPIEHVPDKYTTKESNWQTDKLFSPELDKLYYIEAIARYEEVDEEGNVEIIESPPGKSDTFQIYKVTGYDLFTNVLNFYGITDKDTFMKDNNMKDELLIEGNVIFIRNPTQNQGKPYTLGRDLTYDEKRRIDDLLMSRAKHCVFGLEPINMTTGNFYYNAEDVSVPDYGGEFKISRSYNAKAAFRRSSFGLGWDFEYNKYISYLADGTKVFDRGDGSRIYFEKNADGTYETPIGEYYTLEEREQEFKVEQKYGTKYYFEKNGLLKAVEDKNGNTTRLTYDEDYKLESITTPSGKLFIIECDDEGRITAIRLPNHDAIYYGYNYEGYLVSVTDENGNETRYEYDEKGRMVSFYDGEGNKVITNTYDDQDRVILQEDALGNKAQINYYDGYNESVDNNGNKTTYYYDDKFRVTKVVKPDGNYEEYTYDDDNNLKTQRGAMGRVITFEYDDKGNKTQEKRWDGKTRSFTYDGQNNLRTSQDFNGNTTIMDYDDKGNLLEVERPDGTDIKYTYDSHGQVLTIRDPEGNLTENEYSGADITSVKDPKGNIFNYLYNPMGKIITIEDPMSKLSRLAYSPRGELLNTLLPDSSITEYGYDAKGNNTETIDGEGNAVKFEYDLMDRLKEVEDPLGNKTQYTYDANGNKLEEKDAKGNIKKFEYDALNRLTKITDPMGGETVYERDALGNVLAVTDPEGNKTTYTYNYDVNKPKTIRSPVGQTIRSEYDAEGNLLKTRLPDGSEKSYVYDSLYRLTITGESQR